MLTARPLAPAVALPRRRRFTMLRLGSRFRTLPPLGPTAPPNVLNTRWTASLRAWGRRIRDSLTELPLRIRYASGRLFSMSTPSFLCSTGMSGLLFLGNFRPKASSFRPKLPRSAATTAAFSVPTFVPWPGPAFLASRRISTTRSLTLAHLGLLRPLPRPCRFSPVRTRCRLRRIFLRSWFLVVLAVWVFWLHRVHLSRCR